MIGNLQKSINSKYKNILPHYSLRVIDGYFMGTVFVDFHVIELT